MLFMCRNSIRRRFWFCWIDLFLHPEKELVFVYYGLEVIDSGRSAVDTFSCRTNLYSHLHPKKEETPFRIRIFARLFPFSRNVKAVTHFQVIRLAQEAGAHIFLLILKNCFKEVRIDLEREKFAHLLFFCAILNGSFLER